MLFDRDNLQFEIIDILDIYREKINFSTKKRNFCVLSCRVSGNGSFSYSNKESVYTAGDIIFIPAQIAYTQKSNAEEHLIAIHLRLSNYSGQEIEIFPMFDASVSKWFEDIYTTWKGRSLGYRYRCNILINQLFYRMYQRRELHKNPAFVKIQPSLDFIHNHFTDTSLTIGRVAAASAVSEVYLRKLFQLILHTSPLEYVNRLRIQHAKSLLESRYYSISQAALASGFTDYKHFYTRFRHMEGISPRAYLLKAMC